MLVKKNSLLYNLWKITKSQSNWVPQNLIKANFIGIRFLHDKLYVVRINRAKLEIFIINKRNKRTQNSIRSRITSKRNFDNFCTNYWVGFQFLEAMCGRKFSFIK